tara:strand:- start:1534 stop:2622 length:1089 start_codon:yes stop_codon:yes gene_type:complete
MKKKNSKIEYEIDLLELFKIIWKEKIKIIVIVIASFLVGYTYIGDKQNVSSYEGKINFELGKETEYIKFLAVTNMFDEIKNYQSTQYYKNYSNESQFLNNEGLAYSIYPDKIMDKFIKEILDYEEMVYVLKNNDRIKKQISKLSDKNQNAKLYKYVKLFTLVSPSEINNNYGLKLRWEDKNEMIQILSDVTALTLVNLEDSIYQELEDLLRVKKTTEVNKDLARVDYLLEQSQIAKELNIENNQVENISQDDSNLSLSISTSDAKLDYLRGYKAIDKEISIIRNRKYQDLVNIENEINLIKQTKTDWIFYNVFLIDIKKINVDNTKKNLILFIILGLIIGVLYVLISNAVQSNMLSKKNKFR